MKRAFLMLHHSLTEDGQTVSWGAIEEFHRSWKLVEANGSRRAVSEADAMQSKAHGMRVESPWSDIGYHAGVELVNGRYYAMLGRSAHRQAAACPQGDMNILALHVCCVGNYDLHVPTDEMLYVLKNRVLLPWMNQFGITAEKIVGHHDYNAAKSCPGKLFDIQRIKRMVL